MMWFNFILGSNFIFLSFKLIIIHYSTKKQTKKKFELRIKLNHNIYILILGCKVLRKDLKKKQKERKQKRHTDEK